MQKEEEKQEPTSIIVSISMYNNLYSCKRYKMNENSINVFFNLKIQHSSILHENVIKANCLYGIMFKMPIFKIIYGT